MTGTHFYVYRIVPMDRGPNRPSCGYLYDRTLPTEAYAKERVKELEERGKVDGEQAMYTIDHVIKGAFY